MENSLIIKKGKVYSRIGKEADAREIFILNLFKLYHFDYGNDVLITDRAKLNSIYDDEGYARAYIQVGSLNWGEYGKDNMVIDDGYCYLKITDRIREIWNAGIFELCVLYDDFSECVIEEESRLLEAFEKEEEIAIQLGEL